MKNLALLLATGMFAFGATAVRAEKQPDGKGHVVHTRLAPVLLHKAVPPFKGIHVYQGESRSARK
jgi:hypothetical protein